MIMMRKRKKKSKNYFTQDTEDAIVRYNNEPDPKVRSTIYEREIHYAFFKLTENIIHTFKFYYTEVDDLKDLQHEIITFLLDKIHLFDPSRGAKAYSYFGTIVKRYLIISNTKNYKKRIDTVSINELSENSNYSDFLDESGFSNRRNNILGSLREENYEIDDTRWDLEFNDRGPNGLRTKNDRLSDFVDEYINYVTENIYILFPKPQDAKIADSILELFRRRDFLEIFNKKALYFNIREMVDAKTPKITNIATRLSTIFREKYLIYQEHGYFQH